jgi:folate-binding protein YgfZ
MLAPSLRAHRASASLPLNESILLEQHEAAGARLAPHGAATPVLSYGDVPGEYRAGVAGAALFDESHRGLLRLSGRDQRAFLHRLLANRVRELEPGQGNENLLLSSKGKVLFDFELWVEADATWLCCPPGRAAALAAALDVYLFSEDVRIEDLSAASAPLSMCGPQAEALVAGLLGQALPEALGAHVLTSFAGAPLRIARCAVAGSAGLLLDAGPAAAPDLWKALCGAGARPVGLAARDSLRVEAGAAVFGVDIDENVYPQEARLERSFSLDKGCYIGQEVVAKIDTYGGLNKRLVGLRLSSDEPVARGTPLAREEAGEWRELGLLTSWAWSFALDAPLGLGYAKRRHQDIGLRLRVGAGPQEAEIIALPVRAGALAP